MNNPRNSLAALVTDVAVEPTALTPPPSNDAPRDTVPRERTVDERLIPPQLPRATGVRAATGLRFKVLSFREVEQLPDPEWLVENMLPAKSLAILYGPPGVGKTFVALDIALSIASAQPWAGHQTIPGAVVYVVAEGVAGLSKRVRAWRIAHAVEEVPRFYSIADAPQLGAKQDVSQLIGDLRMQIREPISLIIIDTMARCFVGGDENSAKDVGQLIANADRLRKELGSAVLLVHHTTKSGESERGSSALRGALDTMISLDTVADDISVICEKQKNAAPFPRFALRLVPASESCVLQGTQPGRPDQIRIGSKDLVCLRGLDTFGSEGTSAGDWLEATGLSESTFYRQRRRLVSGEYVYEQDGRYYLDEKGRTAIAVVPAQLSEN